MRICPVCRSQFPSGANFCPHDGHKLSEAQVESAPEEADRFLGKTLDDRYRIEARLGQGGMGVVYAARHVVIDKQVAIKILRYEYCRDRDLVERFLREARAASRIGHPNIVDVTDFGRLADGHIYFVMEYLTGTNLARELRQVGSFTLARTVGVSVQICQALAAAHAKEIIHRDLKPENIFLVNPISAEMNPNDHRKDFVKLLDFGIAKINWGPGTRLTRAGSIFGTPQYMSPEQAAGKDADHRGDVYAMGCILYEMVTGKVPFVADTFMGTLTKHMFEQPVSPRQIRPDVDIPRGIEGVILRALAKNPIDRFQSMSEMSRAVQLGAREELETSPPGPTQVFFRSTDSAKGDRDRKATEFALQELVAPLKDPERGLESRRASPWEHRERKPIPPTDTVSPIRERSRFRWHRIAWGTGLVVVAVVAFIATRLALRHSQEETITDAALTYVVPHSVEDATVADAIERDVALQQDTRTVEKVTVVVKTRPSSVMVYRKTGERLGKTPLRITSAPGENAEYEFRWKGKRVTRTITTPRQNGELVVPLDDPKGSPHLKDPFRGRDRVLLPPLTFDGGVR